MASSLSAFLFLIALVLTLSSAAPAFHRAPPFPANNPNCSHSPTVHIAMTLDSNYLRGTFAAVFSLLNHSSCPHLLHFHFLHSPSPSPSPSLLLSVFPSLRFSLHPFRHRSLPSLLSPSLRTALDNPLNYARNYLPSLLPSSLPKVIYLDSDVVAMDDIASLWTSASLDNSVVAAPEYCHVSVSRYFNRNMDRVFRTRPRPPCYFNTGVMVINLNKWRDGGYSRRIERWMRVQKEERIYELGSLPPLLLVFAGDVEAVEHRWNQHGLGGDNASGACRDVHPGPVSLLHWSGKGKPWDRLDEGRPCPVDRLWKPYDLYVPGSARSTV